MVHQVSYGFNIARVNNISRSRAFSLDGRRTGVPVDVLECMDNCTFTGYNKPASTRRVFQGR